MMFVSYIPKFLLQYARRLSFFNWEVIKSTVPLAITPDPRTTTKVIV